MQLEIVIYLDVKLNISDGQRRGILFFWPKSNSYADVNSSDISHNQFPGRTRYVLKI